MNDVKKSLTLLSLVLISALAFNEIEAQTKAPPQPIISGVVNGKAVSLPKPEYPEDARKERVVGTVNIRVVIDEKGDVISAKAVSGIENASLREASEKAALKAKFLPTRLSGKPVKVSGVIVYNFVSDQSNEEKLKAFGVSTFLFMLRSSAADLTKLNKVFESDDIIKETVEEFSAFSSELSPLKTLGQLQPEARAAKIDEVIDNIRSKLNNSELWQFELGKPFAEIMSQFAVVGSEESPDISKLDENKLKQNLLKIKDLCLSAPPDFPKDVMDKLKELAAFGDKDKIISAENFQIFFDKFGLLIETISPGSTN